MLSLFNSKLRELLDQRGVSQKQLAHELGTTQQTVSRWVQAEAQPDIDTILFVCFYFDIAPNELLGWDDFALEARDFTSEYKNQYAYKYAGQKTKKKKTLPT